MLCTGVITVYAGYIIPTAVRGQYFDNLLGGLAMHLAGPQLLRLLFHAFVVLDRRADPSGAVNTSLIGANGVMNRLAEDGVLLDWFRKPQRRFGTTYRLINLITGLQIFTIVASRGDVYLLGEAYAFGVVWSFFMKSLGVLVLRYHRTDQEYKTPINLRIGGREIPVGLIVTTLILFFVAPGEPAFEADRNDLRRLVHRGPVHHLHDFRARERADARRAGGGARRVQPGHAAGRDRGNHSARVRVACWWPCGTTTTWRTSRACWRKPTCGGTTSW